MQRKGPDGSGPDGDAPSPRHGDSQVLTPDALPDPEPTPAQLPPAPPTSPNLNLDAKGDPYTDQSTKLLLPWPCNNRWFDILFNVSSHRIVQTRKNGNGRGNIGPLFSLSSLGIRFDNQRQQEKYRTNVTLFAQEKG